MSIESALAHVKIRLAQIASGDYKACGHTAEDCAADALFSFHEIEAAKVADQPDEMPDDESLIEIVLNETKCTRDQAVNVVDAILKCFKSPPMRESGEREWRNARGDTVKYSDLYDECPSCTAKEEDLNILRAESLPRHAVHNLFNEIDCRIEHGAESGGHLQYVHKALKAILNDIEGGEA